MSDGAVLNLRIKFEHIECYKCGMSFAVPAVIRRRWQDGGDSFCCPAGHFQHYTESTVDALQKKLEREEKRRQWAESARDQARKDAEAERHRANGYKGAMAKAKKRTAHGVCPCCNRTFKQLAAHMKNKHPEYVETAG